MPGSTHGPHKVIALNQSSPQDFVTNPNKLTSNDVLSMASTFHALHAMSTNLCPVAHRAPSGLQSIETEHFKLQALQTHTGLKFFLTSSADAVDRDMQRVLHAVYALFADYVLKNPFYVVDMPVRCAKFEEHLKTLIGDAVAAVNDAQGGSKRGGQAK
jgi:hypothetical protein